MSSNHKEKVSSPILRTIRCHLESSEDVLRKVWEEMSQINTPLIVQLLKSVSEQPEFEANKESGKITKKEITGLRRTLTKDSGRPYSSVDNLVKEIYSSWLTLYQKRKTQKEGKEYFLNNILKSDAELLEISNCDLQTIRCKAQEILSHPKQILEEIKIKNINKTPTKSKHKTTNKNSKKQKKISKEDTNKNSPKTLDEILYEIHKTTEDVLTRCAVSYLLKNYNKVSELEEDIKKLEKRRTEKEVQIRRLEKQMQATRLPNGRDITGEIYNEVFDNLINQVPKDNEEYKNWIDNIYKKIFNLPYPINYEYDDLSWYKNDKGQIFVYFNGWGDRHFKICCNKRQRHFFERFLEDYKAFKESQKRQDKLSGSLFTLRSVKLLWQQGEGKGEPWKVHKLALHCTYDARLWTAEGTEEARKQNAEKTQKQINQAEENENLDQQQQRDLKKNKSSLSRLNNSFPRPSKPIYQGQSNIIVGISFHPVELATLVIVDINTKEILICKTVKELLGDAFPLLSRRRRQQVHFREEREKAQKKDSPCHLGESKLGEYVDRLLAKRIVEVAKEYQASCIVLPKLKDMREIRTSAIQAKAETKIPGDVNAQKQYVKEYNRQIHDWSYNRLQEFIKLKAGELKISIEFGIQPSYDTLQEQARDLALSAYQCRINTIDR
ncbi:MAG: type V CRISPR-associated protein Cas12k [Nostoc sp. EkiNYC01]|nr:type V CRISPR-associated protein Cas12k [Nostoc sp. EkiNYC01]